MTLSQIISTFLSVTTEQGRPERWRVDVSPMAFITVAPFVEQVGENRES